MKCFFYTKQSTYKPSNERNQTIKMNTIRLTRENAHLHIGDEIIFKTRGNYIIKRIISASPTGKTITIDHPDLKNTLQLVTRKNVYVLL